MASTANKNDKTGASTILAVPQPSPKVLPEESKGAVKDLAAADPATKKPALKKAARAKKTPAKRRKPATSKLAVATANLTKNQLKKDDTKMADYDKSETNNATDTADAKKLEAVATGLTHSVKEATEKAQARAKSAYDSTTEVASEAVTFTKGNVEAMVEATKIFAAGMQDMGRDAVEGSKGAVETMTADAKAFAAVRSPTDLFKLQGEITRRNFETMVSVSSKNTEKMVKLANDSFAPISNRISLAAEKVAKAA